MKSIIIGWRNIKKNGIYSLINIAGLSLGTSVVILILFWVTDELSYDNFHDKEDQIFLVYEHQQFSEGHDLYTYCTPFPLGSHLKDEYGQVEKASTYTNMGDLVVRYQDKTFKDGPIIMADNDFLQIFSFDVLKGNKEALAADDQVVITEEMSHLLFGDESALGKLITIEGKYSFSVGAVVADVPENSTIQFKMLLPIKTIESFGGQLDSWNNNWPKTALQISAGTNMKTLGDNIMDICKAKGQDKTSLFLFPFSSNYLYSISGKHNRVQYIYQFLAIACIILLIGSINFVNLSIAQAEKRWSEIGVRKTLGANKVNLIHQFLVEQGTLIFFCLVLSTMLVMLFLPGFNAVSGKTIHLDMLMNTQMMGMLLGVILMILIFSVVYPSLYLSSFNPILAMRRTNVKRQRSFSLKSALVVVQFVLAVTLISGSIIIGQQINFINQYDLGYDKHNLIYIPLDGKSVEKHEALKQDFKNITGVMEVTRADKLPVYGGNSSWGHSWEGKDPEQSVLICKMSVDKDFIKTMGIKIDEGTSFPEIYDEVIDYEDLQSPQMILNEEAIRRMDLKDPVGKMFSLWGQKDGKIVGVMHDFNFESLHVGVEPLLLVPMTSNPQYLILRLRPEHFAETLGTIKKDWAQITPQTKCEIGFFDERLESMYQSEIKISTLFRYFTGIAIFISCIGLFGLSLFVIERRRKEIGIRKVNGARVFQVMLLLNKDFLKWVIIAFIIATPIAWYVMRLWLENFAFKTNLSWWIFALAGLMAIIIAMVTVSWQSWKVARQNPVEALKYE